VNGLSAANRYFLHRGTVDFRNGFDGLCGLVRSVMRGDPTDGNAWIFINRRRDRMKMLVWEPGGFMLYYKRLESGTFDLPVAPHGEGRITISRAMLVMMLEGIRVEKYVQKKRYVRA